MQGQPQQSAPGAPPAAYPGQQVYPTSFPTNQQVYQQQYAAYQQPPQQQQQLAPSQQEQLRAFWQGQLQEVQQVGNDPTEFKNHQLPLARIKKIMKSDEDVRMISAEAPVLFAKACEMFILELTLRSWIHSEENKRRTLQRNDIAAAITKTDIFDFLVDIVPREELKQETQPAAPSAPATHSMGMYYPYASLPTVQGAGGEQMLRPTMPMDPSSLMSYQQQAGFMGMQGGMQGAQQWAQNPMNAAAAAAAAAVAAAAAANAANAASAANAAAVPAAVAPAAAAGVSAPVAAAPVPVVQLVQQAPPPSDASSQQ